MSVVCLAGTMFDGQVSHPLHPNLFGFQHVLVLHARNVLPDHCHLIYILWCRILDHRQSQEIVPSPRLRMAVGDVRGYRTTAQTTLSCAHLHHLA